MDENEKQRDITEIIEDALNGKKTKLNPEKDFDAYILNVDENDFRFFESKRSRICFVPKGVKINSVADIMEHKVAGLKLPECLAIVGALLENPVALLALGNTTLLKLLMQCPFMD